MKLKTIEILLKKLDLFNATINPNVLTIIADYTKIKHPDKTKLEQLFFIEIERLIELVSRDTTIVNSLLYLNKFNGILSDMQKINFNSLEFYEKFRFNLYKPINKLIRSSTSFKSEYLDIYNKVNVLSWIDYPINCCFIIQNGVCFRVESENLNFENKQLDIFNFWRFADQYAFDNIENARNRKYHYWILPDFEIETKELILLGTGGRFDAKTGGGQINELRFVNGKSDLNYVMNNWFT